MKCHFSLLLEIIVLLPLTLLYMFHVLSQLVPTTTLRGEDHWPFFQVGTLRHRAVLVHNHMPAVKPYSDTKLSALPSQQRPPWTGTPPQPGDEDVGP